MQNLFKTLNDKKKKILQFRKLKHKKKNVFNMYVTEFQNYKQVITDMKMRIKGYRDENVSVENKNEERKETPKERKGVNSVERWKKTKCR